MKTAQNFPCPRRRFALLAACILLAAPVAQATEASNASTNASASSNETLRSYLQLQEQLHLTQQALERNRQEYEALAARNAEAVAARFQAIETTLTTQRVTELESMKSAMETLERSMENNHRMLMIVTGAIASVGFLVLLLTAWLQWRSANRLAEVSALMHSARALPPGPAEAQLFGANDTAQASGRLSAALTQLEHRIHELEHTTHESAAHSAAPAPPAPAENGQHSQTDHAAVLLAKGQSLLHMDKPTEALACFEEILQADPDHGEALVKKGLALEELRRLDEALQCYDRAIAVNGDLTIAYLQKGGLFNRLERYDEALQCYEQALHAQEKAHAS